MPIGEPHTYQTILNINNAVINQRTREGLFREITHVMEPVFHFDRTSILINQPGEDNWHYFSPAKGVTIPGLPADKLPISKGMIPYRAMEEKRTIIVDIPNEPDLYERESLLAAGLSWMICTPLINRGQVIGSLQLSYKETFPLSREGVDLFEKVAQQLALAIDNMLAYEKVERLKDKLAEEKSYLKKESYGRHHECGIN
jgi:GAF domain-containing protein